VMLWGHPEGIPSMPVCNNSMHILQGYFRRTGMAPGSPRRGNRSAL